MRQAKAKTIHVLLATAVLGLVAMPIAFAGAADSPQATASASIKKQLKKLKKRIAALENEQGPGTPDSLPPNGPAGGDLTGNYPNPQIGPNAVGTGELADDAVNGAKIANDTVGIDDLAVGSVDSPEIADGSIQSADFQDNSVQSSDIEDNNVGGAELKGSTAVVGAGNNLANNTPGDATVQCPAGTRVIGGGFAWTQDEANSMIASAPDETDPRRTWAVRGMPTGGSSNSLFAWANCLAA